MTQQVVVALARRALTTGILVSGPVLLAGLTVGLIVSVIQAVTSVREITLVMIPKILAVVATLFVLLPWMLKILVAYATETFQWMRVLGN